MEEDDKAKRIAELNDRMRLYIGTRDTDSLGTVVMTRAITTLDYSDQLIILSRVKEFKNFTDGDDPYQEHDFGAFSFKGTKYYWKIDYYSPDLQGASEAPEDPDRTYRILTIMEASEY